MTDSKTLWEWYSKVIDGKIERKNVSIVLYDQQGSEVKRWSFERAYPTKWVGPGIKSDENAVAIETLELVHEGMKLS